MTATAMPMTGNRSANSGAAKLALTLAVTALAMTKPTMATRGQSIDEPGGALPDDRREPLLGARGGRREDEERDDGGDVGMQDVDGRDVVDPHHGRRRVAQDAAGAAGIRSRDDRGEVADLDASAEQRMRGGTADQGRGDVIQESGSDEYDAEQCECPGPVVGQVVRQRLRQAAAARNGPPAARSRRAAGRGWPGSPTRARSAPRGPRPRGRQEKM